MTQKILAVLFDCGDTLVDEGTEVKNEAETVLKADLIPGAAETLRALKSRGYRLALVADGQTRSFQNILAQHQLTSLFDAFAISEEVGVSKPHPRIFHHALDQLSISPEQYNRVVMIGNHLARDVKGANQLGIISIWFDWAPRRPKTPADPSEQPCYTVKTHAELLRRIDLLESNDL